jgi:hypothetical protein
MSDSERDAWLREALRHAPDADAAPPRDLSETILAQARAAARADGARARVGRRRHSVVALWDWLARPPVAAGFASVVAATLVGLMWWDRPLDETLPPRPGTAAERAPTGTAPVPNAPAYADAIAPPAQVAQQQGDPGQRGDGRGAAPAAQTGPAEVQLQAPPPNVATADARALRRKLDTANTAALADRAAAKPSPFPRGDDAQSAARLANKKDSDASKKDSDASDAKAVDRAAKEAPSDALAARDAALAKSLPAPVPAPPGEAQRSEPPAAFAGQRANAVAQAPSATKMEIEAAKRARSAATMAQAPPPAMAAAPAPPTAPPAAAPPSVLHDSASAELREKEASAFASPRVARAPPSGGLASAERQGAGAAPLAPILAAIAVDPSRWSRATTSGSVVALEPGWRDWLAQLDAAARDRWQAVGAAEDRERAGATTLRLVDGGRSVVVVRLDGTTVGVDTIERGERWQATLPAAVADQLRAAAERLGR